MDSVSDFLNDSMMFNKCAEFLLSSFKFKRLNSNLPSECYAFNE